MSAMLLVLFGAFSATDLPAPIPMAMPAAGTFKPFDLTYLPRTGPSVLAVRPCEFVKHLGNQDKTVTESARRLLAAAFAFLDGDLKATVPPALVDIDQVIVAARINMGIGTAADGRSTFGGNDVSSGLVRTVKAYDWTESVKKWFPKAELIKHADREYFRVPIGFGDKASHLGLFVADNRTLVFDTDEDELKELLNRLKKGKKPSVPTGWETVNRDLIAAFHNTTAEKWLSVSDTAKRDADLALATVARKSTSLAIGFSAGERTSLRMVVTTRDECDAQDVRSALKVVVRSLTDEESTMPAVAKLFSQMKITRDGSVVRVNSSIEGNLLRLLLDPDSER